jgi:hypothetical protein
MKAYQVFTGEVSKHGHQIYDLVATYFNKEKALEHCKDIAEAASINGDILEESKFYSDGKYKDWDAIGWDRFTIARFEEIEITE